jgi:hypothetical protein
VIITKFHYAISFVALIGTPISSYDQNFPIRCPQTPSVCVLPSECVVPKPYKISGNHNFEYLVFFIEGTGRYGLLNDSSVSFFLVIGHESNL